MRSLDHQEAGHLISECQHSVELVLHTSKPRPVPSGNVVYSGWLGKKGGSGITPRNWRRRWFVLRDDCIAYYYNSPEVTDLVSENEVYITMRFACRIHMHLVLLF